MTQGTTPPGWYDDGQGAQRWWDGTQWTEHTQPTPGAPETPAATPPAEPPQPGIHDDITRFGTLPPADGGGTPPASPPPATPSADVTMVAPNRGIATPGQQGGYTPPATPGYGTPAAGGYTPPGQAPPGQSGQYGTQPPAWQNQFPASGGSGGGGKGKLFALIGGGVAVLVVVLIILFVVIGGGGGGPKGTVEEFFDKAKDGDCSFIELASNNALGVDADGRDEAIKQFKGFCSAAGEEFTDQAKGCDIKIGDAKESGDKATVPYEVSGCENADDNEAGELALVKEDGDWRIDDLGAVSE